MELLSDPQVWLAFATLTALEIVLGIDNIIFISILVVRLPEEQQARGRTIGLGARDDHAHSAAACRSPGSWVCRRLVLSREASASRVAI